MRTSYTGQGARVGPGRFWGAMVRLAVLIMAGAALLAIVLIGVIFILPLMLFSGVALHLYLRRRLRQARRRSWDGVIDAEYTIVERR